MTGFQVMNTTPLKKTLPNQTEIFKLGVRVGSLTSRGLAMARASSIAAASGAAVAATGFEYFFVVASNRNCLFAVSASKCKRFLR